MHCEGVSDLVPNYANGKNRGGAVREGPASLLAPRFSEIFISMTRSKTVANAHDRSRHSIKADRSDLVKRDPRVRGGLQVFLRNTNCGFCGRATEKFSD